MTLSVVLFPVKIPSIMIFAERIVPVSESRAVIVYSQAFGLNSGGSIGKSGIIIGMGIKGSSGSVSVSGSKVKLFVIFTPASTVNVSNAGFHLNNCN